MVIRSRHRRPAELQCSVATPFSFGCRMGPVNKRINFAFDIGERVWLLCDPVSSGIVDGFRVGLGYLPKCDACGLLIDQKRQGT